jgi:phosphoribosyl 1,2-cyclic phosphate phosphodiesterase
MTPEISQPQRFSRMTFLGTGTSTGIPVIGCCCPVCQSPDPRNKRLRSSILLETEDITLLVDSGPDLRMQALRAGLKKVDAVLYTHGHMDHVVGFDELRAFCWDRDDPLPLYANPGCMEILKTMFAWAFADTNVYRGYIKPWPMVFEGPFNLGSLRVTPLPVIHGAVQTSGFLFEREGMKSLAYIPDVKQIPPQTMELIRGCDCLILDTLHFRKHPTHLSMDESLALIEEAGVSRAYLVHCSHEIDHEVLENILPATIRIAYDSLCLQL